MDLANIVNEYFIVELQVGTKVDCKDLHGMWLIAQVTEVAKDWAVNIHYCGWDKTFDEWITQASVSWRFDLLNKYTPVGEDLIISNFSNFEDDHYFFYRECPSVSQRIQLVRRLCSMGFPQDAVALQYEEYQWNQSPFVIVSDLRLEFPNLLICNCLHKQPICEFCSSVLLR